MITEKEMIIDAICGAEIFNFVTAKAAEKIGYVKLSTEDEINFTYEWDRKRLEQLTKEKLYQLYGGLKAIG